MHVVGGGDESIVEFTTKEQKVKKSLKAALAAVCLIAAGAFFMGCSSPSGGGSYTPKYAVGDIVLNDGTKVAYSVAKDYTGDELTTFQGKAVAVIFRADTESAPALGVGIKHHRSGLKWCIKDAAGYGTKFTETVCEPDEGTSAGSLTFKNSPNTDGSKNLAKMIAELTKTNPDNNDTGVTCNADGTINFSASPKQTTLKTNYPAFEFAYYYGKNGHNITSGSTFENGWYLPSESELNDIYQANKTDNVIENALGVTGGDKFEYLFYWSSSQDVFSNGTAYDFSFSSGACDNYNKDYGFKYSKNYSVCAIRAFN